MYYIARKPTKPFFKFQTPVGLCYICDRQPQTDNSLIPYHVLQQLMDKNQSQTEDHPFAIDDDMIKLWEKGLDVKEKAWYYKYMISKTLFPAR